MQLRAEVNKYKSLYEQTMNELNDLKLHVSKLESKLEFDSDGNADADADADVDGNSTTTIAENVDDIHWVEVTDPDTGNVFLWNKDTGETRWKNKI